MRVAVVVVALVVVVVEVLVVVVVMVVVVMVVYFRVGYGWICNSFVTDFMCILIRHLEWMLTMKVERESYNLM